MSIKNSYARREVTFRYLAYLCRKIRIRTNRIHCPVWHIKIFVPDSAKNTRLRENQIDVPLRSLSLINTRARTCINHAECVSPDKIHIYPVWKNIGQILASRALHFNVHRRRTHFRSSTMHSVRGLVHSAPTNKINASSIEHTSLAATSRL